MNDIGEDSKIKFPSIPIRQMLQPITLNSNPRPVLDEIGDVIKEYNPVLEPFSKKDRLLGVIAVAIPVLLLATWESFTGTSIFDTRLRNLLYIATIFVLVTMAYAVYNYKNVEKFTTIGYIYLFFAIFTMLAMIAGRIGFGLAITSSFFMFILVAMLYRETKEPLLIISILIVLAWAVGITLIYLGYVSPDIIE